jgi:hypothetical protein
VDLHPNERALREARRIQRLQGASSVCTFCGYKGLVIPVSAKWLKARGCTKQFLEEHHVNVHKHDSQLTTKVCRNCHAECTAGQIEAGIKFQFERDLLERTALTLEAQAAFFENFARSQRRLAEQVRSAVK